MKNKGKIAIIIIMTCFTIGAMLSILEFNKRNDHEIGLIIDGNEVEGYKEPYVENKEVYLPYEVVKDYIDENMFLNDYKKRVYIDIENKNIELEDDHLTSFVKENKIRINIPIKKKNEQIYVPVSLLDKIFGIKVQFIEYDQVVVIDKLLPQADRKLNEKREDFDTKNKKINLAWEYVGNQTPDLEAEEKIESLDIVVPTWFSVVSEDGIVVNNADRKYVDEAHKKGYKVWGLVNNSFDPKLTSKILKDEKVRKNIIGQLLMYASLYDLDGINIDFENMYYRDKDRFVTFVEEIKYYSKKQNMVLSIDVTVPSASEQWSKVYDRKALGEIVDYVAVMAYDEHWASSPVSGSVASIGWVERGVVRSLESIPEEKILLGLPFYTRRWKEQKNEDGKIKVESRAISMTLAEKIIKEKNASVTWDEETGQYYAEYNEDGAVCKIWLEDKRSIAKKVDLVEKYKLAGTASWRKGYEDVEVWVVLQEVIKNGKTYAELGFKE